MAASGRNLGYPCAAVTGVEGSTSSALVSDVAATIVARCLEPLGADAGFVATLTPDGANLDVTRMTRYADKSVHLSFPADAPYPLAHAARTGEALFIESNEQLVCDHPGLVRVKEEDHACATLPLFADGKLVGAMNLGFDEPRRFTADEHEKISLLGRYCADAMAVARRVDTEIRRP